MNIILSGTLFFLLNSTLNAALTSRGDTKTYRNFLVAGFFLNVVMDPWFMYGGFGVPAMGVGGIGFSTVIIQILGSGYLIYRIKRRKIMEGIRLKEFIPQKRPMLDLFFCAYIFLNISVSTLQGIKKPMYAIFVGTYRQFLMPLPLFLLLSVHLGFLELSFKETVLLNTNFSLVESGSTLK